MGIELNRREVRKRESGRADEQLSYSRQLLDRGVWPKIVVIAAVFFILVAPSAWMLATISPLWKDVDAYGQVTAPPGEATILLYGPAYCFLARLPLYIGYLYDCWRAGTVHPAFTAFFAQPALSDSGVFLLLLVQHLALCAGASLLILAATRCVIARLVLALLWAANPVFYVWANCRHRGAQHDSPSADRDGGAADRATAVSRAGAAVGLFRASLQLEHAYSPH